MNLKDKMTLKVVPTLGRKSTNVNFRVSNSFILAVDAVQRDMGILSRSETIRLLAEVALEELSTDNLPKTPLPEAVVETFKKFRVKFKLSDDDLRRLILQTKT